MTKQLSLVSIVFATILIAFNGIVLTEANYYCWDFDDSDPWVNTGARDWIWSGNSEGITPDLTNIDRFSATSGYVWFQDQETPPNTGSIITTPADGVTIYPNDVVSISIWRHPAYYDGNTRPVLNFVSNGGTHKQAILWSYNTDNWDDVSLICGPMAEPCCLTYPCTGYFEVDGTIMARDELLAIDNVEINDGCSHITPAPPTTTTTTPTTTTTTPTTTTTTPTTTTTTPTTTTTTPTTTTTTPTTTTTTPTTTTTTPTTTTTTPTTTTTTPTTTLPPPPDNWCCVFETKDVCNWSLAFSSNGWHWSRVIQPSFPVAALSGYYIWEEDESAEVFTTQLEEVPNDSYFTIDYFFNTGTEDASYNNLRFTFASDVGPEIILGSFYANQSDWRTATLSNPDGVCNSNPTCNGEFRVHSYNKPGNKQVSAVDNFSVNDACAYACP